MSERPTFSQSWNRVAKLTPTLRPQVTVQRQLYRGEPWHIVHDPVTNQFFRLNPVAWHLVGLLDGRRNIDEVWRMTLDRFGDDAPTQNEVIGLLSQLNQSNLLRVDLPADAEPLLRRQQQRTMRKVGQHAMSILFLKIPFFNPDRMLTWLAPLARPFLSKWGMIVWSAWILFCLYSFVPHAGTFFSDIDSALEPRNWGWMLVLFMLVKAWHELGHGLMCKRFGGAVPETGLLFMVLMPAPYVDATSAWNFSDKKHRILVGAAGMIFELVVAGIALMIWINADPSTLTRQLSYNVVLLASVTTVIFNANPLMRFDGYYMLSDWLEVPNLADRSLRHLRYWCQRYAYGMEHAQSVATSVAEQYLLSSYGVLSLAYRILIMISIALLLAEHVVVIGMALAVWTVCSFTILPAGKFVHWLATSPQLGEHRVRAVAVTLALAVVVLGFIGLIPFDDHRRAEGVIESTARTEIAAQTDGFVRSVLVETGQQVKAGQVIVICDNPELRSQREAAERALRKAQIALRQALSKEAVDVRINQAKVEALTEELAKLEQKIERLEIRSPQDGVISAGLMSQLEGQFLKRGQVIGQVQDLGQLRVTALVDQQANVSLFDAGNQIREIEIRTVGAIPVVLPSEVIESFPAGLQALPHPALAAPAGGPVAIDPQDQKGQRALRPQFEFWLKLPPRAAHEAPYFPGQRVFVRFTLEHPRPLLQQWIYRGQQLIRDRLKI